MKKSQRIGTLLAGLVFLIFAGRCSEKQSPVEVTTHPVQWNEQTSALFHGKKVVENNTLTSCQSCHGSTLHEQGVSGVACADCHNSGQVESVLNHPQRVKDLGWNLSSCRVCHGNDYEGKGTSASCTTAECHVREEGPEACVTCHGDFSKTFASGALTLQDIAPPQDLTDETRPLSAGVGLHQYHLRVGLTCIGCHGHNVREFDDPEHIDGDGVAELNSQFITSWDRDKGTCTAVCHKVDDELVEKQWIIR